MQIKIQYVTLPETARILCVSDIHGSIEVLKALLHAANYQVGMDYLMLLGDFSEKGKYPLATLRFMMELSTKNHVYALLGNCDHGNYKIFFEEYCNTYFLENLSKPQTLVYDMYQEFLQSHLGTSLTGRPLQLAMAKYYEKELDWLKALPQMIETADHIFVHAAIENRVDYQNSDFETVIMQRYFYNQAHQAPKIVVCGHFPTTIYQKDGSFDDVIFDKEKRICCIDGGMVVKRGGQLNLWIMVKTKDEYRYKSIHQTGLPIGVVVDNQAFAQPGKGTCWPNFRISIIERGTYFSKVKVENTDEICYIKNEYITKEGTTTVDDCPSTILKLNKGDVVDVIDNTCAGYILVKSQSHQGWIKRELLKIA